MKKNRNSFFQEYGYNSYNNNIPQNMQNIGFPNQMVSSNSSFYSGPAEQNNNMFYDIDSRISKIERELNRLDSRITALEKSNPIEQDYNYSKNNMYMV